MYIPEEFLIFKTCLHTCVPRALHDRFDVDIKVRAVLACDNDPQCQAHIKAMNEVEILLSDVGEVAAGSGVNLLTGESQTLEECDVLSAGTSCVNLSAEILGCAFLSKTLFSCQGVERLVSLKSPGILEIMFTIHIYVC